MAEQRQQAGYTQQQIEQLMQKAQIKEAATEPDQDDDRDDLLVNVQRAKHNIRRSLLALRTEEYKTEDGRVYELELKPGQQIVRGEDGLRVTDPDDQEMLCNQTCVRMIFQTIEGHVNNNLAGSYFELKDIEQTGVQASNAIARKLYEYQDRYDIDGPADAQQIMSIVNANLKGAIKKAYKGRLLKHGESTRSIKVLERPDGDTVEDDSGGILPNIT